MHILKPILEGTYNILEASKQLNIESILTTSTSETYGTAQYVPIDETHPMVGQSPYSASKIAADQLAISYYRSFALPVKIVSPFNTYGPRQSAQGNNSYHHFTNFNREKRNYFRKFRANQGFNFC